MRANGLAHPQPLTSIKQIFYRILFKCLMAIINKMPTLPGCRVERGLARLL